MRTKLLPSDEGSQSTKRPFQELFEIERGKCRSSLRLREYVFAAWWHWKNGETPSDEVAFRRDGEYRNPLWEFARDMKSPYAPAAFSDSLDAAEMVEQVLRSLVDAGRAPWEAFFTEVDSPKEEFMKAYDAVRYPTGTDPTDLAFSGAEKFPLKPARSISAKYDRFLSAAAQLQGDTPDGPIYLPTRKWGEKLGCDNSTVAYYIRFARSQGILILRRDTNHLARQSPRYCFRLEMFDRTTGKQTITHSAEVQRYGGTEGTDGTEGSEAQKQQRS